MDTPSLMSKFGFCRQTSDVTRIVLRHYLKSNDQNKGCFSSVLFSIFSIFPFAGGLFCSAFPLCLFWELGLSNEPMQCEELPLDTEFTLQTSKNSQSVRDLLLGYKGKRSSAKLYN